MDLIDKPRGLIKDFIFVKDNSLPKSFCDEVIKKFDEDPRQRDGIIGKDTNQRVDKSLKDHLQSCTLKIFCLFQILRGFYNSI